MAHAESAGVRNFVRIETCGHFMCECKTRLDDSPKQALVIPEIIIENERMSTELQIETGEDEKKITVRGVQREDEIIRAFNNCEGPEITANGVVCGAIYRLGRK